MKMTSPQITECSDSELLCKGVSALNILYLHGLGSSGNSNTVKLLREALPNDTIYAPDLPFDMKDAVEYVREFYYSHSVDVVIGKSLGGFYACLCGGVSKIIVNPALKPVEGLTKVAEKNNGVLTNFVTNESVPIEKYLADNKVADIEKYFYGFVFDGELISETIAVFGDHDEFFSFKDFFAHYSDNYHVINCGHRMTEEVAKKTIPNIIQHEI